MFSNCVKCSRVFRGPKHFYADILNLNTVENIHPSTKMYTYAPFQIFNIPLSNVTVVLVSKVMKVST